MVKLQNVFTVIFGRFRCWCILFNSCSVVCLYCWIFPDVILFSSSFVNLALLCEKIVSPLFFLLCFILLSLFILSRRCMNKKNYLFIIRERYSFKESASVLQALFSAFSTKWLVWCKLQSSLNWNDDTLEKLEWAKPDAIRYKSAKFAIFFIADPLTLQSLRDH